MKVLCCMLAMVLLFFSCKHRSSYAGTTLPDSDGNEAWVTTWTLRSFTNAKGQRDSLEYVQDMQFKDGKIVKTGEYVRHVKAH